ncbi:Golgi apparatus membrane protein TVP38 [Ceratobasidium sp. AG-Ba]|nr:Golgi apparatus membrane protein TVP38 [Ceratobasidium sp. AG-Ba]
MASAEHSPTSPRLEELRPISTNENTPLVAAPDNQRSYTGLAKYMPALDPNARKLVFMAGLKVLLLFIVGSIVLGGTLWAALPTLEEADRPMLRIPKSFNQLQELNTLLKKYRDVYPYRIFVCYVITYLYLQAFSLPGSMYLSILGGAVWGVPRALPLACSCVATGATLCYLISAALGPALLAVPSWRARLDAWTQKIDAQRDNLMSYLIVIRIAPFPPHWVVNVLCPHVGIGIPRFWISTFFGIMGVSVIHTTIGGGLDQMTSAEDFHLISWRNFGLLSAVVVAVLIPVGLRWSWKRELEDAGEDEVRLAGGPAVGAGKKKSSQPVLLASDDEDEDQGEYVSEERARQEAARMDLEAFYRAPTRWWSARRERRRQAHEQEEDAALAALAGE